MKQKKILRPLYFVAAMSFSFALLKLWVGYSSGSSSLRSMGLNNSADFLYSLIMILGMWMSIQPADSNHPEGHYRYESIVGISIGLLIISSGFLVQYDALQTFLHGRKLSFIALPLIVQSTSIAIKIGFAWYLKQMAETASSPALQALSRDQISDVLADSSVVFALFSARFLWPALDPLVAALIGLFIIKIGFDSLRENFGHLTGEAASGELRHQVEEIIRSETKFAGPFHLKAHHVGPRVFLSFMLKAPGNKRLATLHDEEERIRRKLLKIEPVERVYIHLQPNEID